MPPNKTEANRWWVYQQERFPVSAHGALILAFSLSAVSYSALLRGVLPDWRSAAVAFFTAFFAFLHLRLADEFKDAEEDARFRPYRPVPRGLVKLRELGMLWIVTGLLQLGLALIFDARLIPILIVLWAYLGLMSKEFFCRDWLKRHPFHYMWSHMFIMPLIDFYATACDWLSHAGHPPKGLFWFVAVSFFNGFVIEIGRKIRAPEDEEHGVETYSALWGRAGAVRAWWLALGLAAAFAMPAAWCVHFLPVAAICLGLLSVWACATGTGFIRRPAPGKGKGFELISGIWTLVLYLSLGFVPMLWKLLR